MFLKSHPETYNFVNIEHHSGRIVTCKKMIFESIEALNRNAVYKTALLVD